MCDEAFHLPPSDQVVFAARGGPSPACGILDDGGSSIPNPGTQQHLDWDGENMRAHNCPDADQFIHPVYRKVWEID